MNSTIAQLNDRFRQGDTTLGQHIMTSGVQALAPDELNELIRLVRDFDQFTSDNDPYAEHDFGRVTLSGKEFFWKIDYYDPTLTVHSVDPASPNATRRVMTLMKASEY